MSAASELPPVMAASPASPTPRLAPCCDCTTAVLYAILVVLVIVAIVCLYRTWRRRHIGPAADCKGYPSGMIRTTCEDAIDMCNKAFTGRDAAACRAAVGACMPAVQAAGAWGAAHPGGPATPQEAADLFNVVAPLVPACAAAAQKISPEGAAKALQKMGVGLEVPASLAPFYKNAETRGNVVRMARLAPGAVDWTLRLGQHLPVLPGAPAREGFVESTPGGFPATCNPLCPQAECYDDMGCGPQGSCQAYFPDDPTYGGQCVPS